MESKHRQQMKFLNRNILVSGDSHIPILSIEHLWSFRGKEFGIPFGELFIFDIILTTGIRCGKNMAIFFQNRQISDAKIIQVLYLWPVSSLYFTR